MEGRELTYVYLEHLFNSTIKPKRAMKKFQFMALSMMTIGLLQFSVFQVNASKLPNPVSEVGAYFSSSLLNQMMSRKGCDGIRFYNVESPNGGETILAVCTSGGADMEVKGKDYTKYQMYDGIDGASAIVVPLGLTDARNACTNIGEGAYAVTFSNSDLESILAVEGTKGVLLLQTTLPNGETSLDAQSASINGGAAEGLSTGMSMTNAHPCPSACGSDPTQGYLINLME